MEKGEIATTDLADFGYREIRGAIELLDTWMKHGLPEDFYEHRVRVMFNTKSGLVFLTNSDFQVALINGDKLEEFYTCSKCGREGFKDEFEKDDDCRGCREIAGVEEDTEEVDG